MTSSFPSISSLLINPVSLKKLPLLMWCYGLGALLNLALPPIGFWMILPLSITPFLWTLDQQSRSKMAWWTSYAYFFGYFTVGLYWISISLSEDWAQFFWLLPFSLIGIPFILSLIMSPAFYLFWHFSGKTSTKLVGMISIFMMIELIRTYLLFQFSWNLLGYSLASSSCFLVSASLWGVFGLTILSLLFGACPYLFLKRHTRSQGLFISIILLIIYGWGSFQLKNHSPTFLPLSMRLVQPNISQSLKWSPTHAFYVLQKLLSLSVNSPRSPSPTLVIWPESAIPFFLSEHKLHRERIVSSLPPQSLLVTGGLRRELSSSLVPIRAWNSIFFLTLTGEIHTIYDKTHLVPFGEYIPFRNLFTLLPLKKLTHGSLDFSKGEGNKTYTLPLSKNALSFTLSPLICYEISFPHQVTSHHQRPTWILNLTNDAWFGKSSGPYQHLQMAQVRAAEEALPVIRVANTGISAVIDPLGRILESLPLNQEGVLNSFLPKPLPPTLYSQYGNWISLLLLICMGCLLIGIEYRISLYNFLKKCFSHA